MNIQNILCFFLFLFFYFFYFLFLFFFFEIFLKFPYLFLKMFFFVIFIKIKYIILLNMYSILIILKIKKTKNVIKKINKKINFIYYIFCIENLFFKIYEKKNLYFKELYIRCKADLENLKRKTNEEISKSYKYSIENFSENLLPVLDSLESTLSTNFINSENILEGIRLTLKIFTNVLIKKDIGFILPNVGDLFNPYKHLAVSIVSYKDKLDNSIINILQKGYYIFERILRPALVVVNKVEK